MIDHFALCVYSAWVRAGRCTFLIDASKVQGTLAVHHALGSAVRRTADKVREASANGKAVYIATLAVWSAGRRTARIFFRWKGCAKKSVVILILYKLLYTTILPWLSVRLILEQY